MTTFGDIGAPPNLTIPFSLNGITLAPSTNDLLFQLPPFTVQTPGYPYPSANYVFYYQNLSAFVPGITGITYSASCIFTPQQPPIIGTTYTSDIGQTGYTFTFSNPPLLDPVNDDTNIEIRIIGFPYITEEFNISGIIYASGY